MNNSLFLQRLQKGEILIADGATGSNLLQRGLPRGKTGENWVLEKPEEIVRLQQEFIAAGAQIILTSTFSASPLRLEETELAGKTVELNRRAVELSRQAVDGRPVMIGGSIGPCGKLLKPYGPVTEEAAAASFAEQARALSEAGVDILVIETHFDLKEAAAALSAARSVSALPIVCSFSYDRGVRTIMGVKPTQMGKEMAKLGVDVVGINCGRSLEENLVVLKELRIATDLPIWFKPNAGIPQVDEEGRAAYLTTPEDMANRVKEWLAAGAQVVGGCCGTSPGHLRSIARAATSQP